MSSSMSPYCNNQNLDLNQTNRQNDISYTMTLNIKNKKQSIKINKNSNSSQLAYEFSRDNNLDYKAMELIKSKIDLTIAKINEKINKNQEANSKNSNNNLNNSQSQLLYSNKLKNNEYDNSLQNNNVSNNINNSYSSGLEKLRNITYKNVKDLSNSKSACNNINKSSSTSIDIKNNYNNNLNSQDENSQRIYILKHYNSSKANPIINNSSITPNNLMNNSINSKSFINPRKSPSNNSMLKSYMAKSSKLFMCDFKIEEAKKQKNNSLYGDSYQKRYSDQYREYPFHSNSSSIKKSKSSPHIFKSINKSSTLNNPYSNINVTTSTSRTNFNMTMSLDKIRHDSPMHSKYSYPLTTTNSFFRKRLNIFDKLFNDAHLKRITYRRPCHFSRLDKSMDSNGDEISGYLNKSTSMGDITCDYRNSYVVKSNRIFANKNSNEGSISRSKSKGKKILDKSFRSIRTMNSFRYSSSNTSAILEHRNRSCKNLNNVLRNVKLKNMSMNNKGKPSFNTINDTRYIEATNNNSIYESSLKGDKINSKGLSNFVNISNNNIKGDNLNNSNNKFDIAISSSKEIIKNETPNKVINSINSSQNYLINSLNNNKNNYQYLVKKDSNNSIPLLNDKSSIDLNGTYNILLNLDNTMDSKYVPLKNRKQKIKPNENEDLKEIREEAFTNLFYDLINNSSNRTNREQLNNYNLKLDNIPYDLEYELSFLLYNIQVKKISYNLEEFKILMNKIFMNMNFNKKRVFINKYKNGSNNQFFNNSINANMIYSGKNGIDKFGMNILNKSHYDFRKIQSYQYINSYKNSNCNTSCKNDLYMGNKTNNRNNLSKGKKTNSIKRKMIYYQYK